MAPLEHLSVIGLVSGGKDSILSLLHCVANGHRIVALANLYPPSSAGPGLNSLAFQGEGDSESSGAATMTSTSQGPPPVSVGHQDGEGKEGKEGKEGEQQEEDLNSFMYQTVGHTVVPLLAAATGLPLFRHPIVGGAVQSGSEYQASSPADETESMVPLLEDVMRAHPEANALCAGAILSTYQRTRVESVATRLGLVPLAYLWQFPVLSSSSSASGDAQLLRDLGTAGLEARIVKVASAGLDEQFLWADIASPPTIARVERALQRFGAAAEGAVLGEGGEFETLVLDGPPWLFKRRIVVHEADRKIVREGGGSAWLSIRTASVVPKPEGEGGAGVAGHVRIPELLDSRFAAVLAALARETPPAEESSPPPPPPPPPLLRWRRPASGRSWKAVDGPLSQWSVLPDPSSHRFLSIEDQTHSVVSRIRAALACLALPPTAVANTVVVLRDMTAFPVVNRIYAPLFPDPNPPARVTIACGDRLPTGTDIAVFLTVLTRRRGGGSDRRGLHVQSRSYWAPANIGPYSQAVAVPLLPPLPRLEEDDRSPGPVAVAVAGQIPLVPATMELPAASRDDFRLQVVLALQHLWRVGVEMGVQWWCGAVAYVPLASATATTAPSYGRQRAVTAARVWEATHTWSHDPPDEDEGGPDLWDRTHDAAYRSFGGARARPELPDWEALESPEGSGGGGGDWRPVPPMFVAEVAALPRAAGVEWHAQVGLSHVEPASVRCLDPLPVVSGVLAGTAWCTAVRAREREMAVVHCAVALHAPTDGRKIPSPAREMDTMLRSGLAQFGDWDVQLEGRPLTPDLAYADLDVLEDTAESWFDITRAPVIPCASLVGCSGRAVGRCCHVQHHTSRGSI